VTQWGRNEDDLKVRKKRFTLDEELGRTLPPRDNRRLRVVAVVVLITFAGGALAVAARSCISPAIAR
jgi:hypothetical protein